MFVQNGEELPKVYSADKVWELSEGESPLIANGGSGYQVGDSISFTGGDLDQKVGRTSLRSHAMISVSQVNDSGAVEKVMSYNRGQIEKAAKNPFKEVRCLSCIIQHHL